MTILKGKAFWAAVAQPNTTFEPVWQVDLALDKAGVKAAKATGVEVKNKGDDRGDFISIKRKVNRKDGGTNNPPAVVDNELRPFTDLIGNGSLVNVKFKTFDWEYRGKSGVGTDLVKIQVVEHVSYAGDSDEEDFEVIGGESMEVDDFDDIPLADAG